MPETQRYWKLPKAGFTVIDLLTKLGYTLSEHLDAMPGPEGYNGHRISRDGLDLGILNLSPDKNILLDLRYNPNTKDEERRLEEVLTLKELLDLNNHPYEPLQGKSVEETPRGLKIQAKKLLNLAEGVEKAFPEITNSPIASIEAHYRSIPEG